MRHDSAALSRPWAVDDTLLEAAYRAELSKEPLDPDATVEVDGHARRGGELRAIAIADLAARVSEHSLLRRADDAAKVAALRFVERRLVEGDKIVAFDGSGAFSGFLRRVLSNLLLDWLRSPTGKAELRRAEHDELLHDAPEETELELPSEEFERQRRLVLHHLVAVRALRSLPPGRGVPLRLALWPAYAHDEGDLADIAAFAHCHETSRGAGDSRACDAGKRCTAPPDPWRAAHARELASAKEVEPSGLSRKSIAELTRIGLGKPMPKREGAVCERISKARLLLVEELRRSGIRGVAS